MTKRPDISTVSSGYNGLTPINDNFTNIQEKFDNTLSLDGSTPNAMSSSFDMNGYNVINVNAVYADTLFLNGSRLLTSVSAQTWRSDWLTTTSYNLNDLVKESGNVYICLEAHTSATFATDLAALKWELYSVKGETGAGTGDLLASNNLSDLASAASALGNLGLTATAAELNTMSGVTSTANEINILDGATVSVTELNYSVGVTSGIQTQIDSKPDTGDLVTTYTSSDTAITVDTTQNFTHNLGGEPDIVNVFLVCNTAEHGYTIGDIVPLNLHANNTGGNDNHMVKANTTQVEVRIRTVLRQCHESTDTTAVTFTSTSWDLRINAIKF
jgi:hypothetical protein